MALGGEAWPKPHPEWLCLACGAEYRDEEDSIVYTGRVVDDEDLLLPWFAGVRESNRERGGYYRDDLDRQRVMKSYDDETIYVFKSDSDD